jgi:hypothetical protein
MLSALIDVGALMSLPLNDLIAASIAQLVDDAKSETGYQEPSHSDLISTLSVQV